MYTKMTSRHNDKFGELEDCQMRCLEVADMLSQVILRPATVISYDVAYYLVYNLVIHKHAHAMKELLAFAIQRGAHMLILKHTGTTEQCHALFQQKVPMIRDVMMYWMNTANRRTPDGPDIILRIAEQSWNLALARVTLDRRMVLEQVGFVDDLVDQIMDLAWV